MTTTTRSPWTNRNAIAIRRATAADAVCSIFQAVVAGGDTYVFAPDTPREEPPDYFLGANRMSCGRGG